MMSGRLVAAITETPVLGFNPTAIATQTKSPVKQLKGISQNEF